MMGWIDVHTHLNFLKGETPEQAIHVAQAAGVERFITIGTEPGDHEIVLQLAEKHFPVVTCTLGVHPHEAGLFDETVAVFLEKQLPRKEVVAVGEIGLDYYYNKSTPEVQREAFRRQLDIARRMGMPVEIHTRDAEDDTIAILKEFAPGEIKGLLHCFTGSERLARAALDLGLDISISGVITFKNADTLRDVVRIVPLDRLHVETDAPFLAPVPMRGKSNVPAFVVHTAAVVAELKQVSSERLMQAAADNARRLFRKLQWS